ncbi:hypothetical protein LOK49_LG04G02601 [Camellia lanceoleosa]|uniref:Uncharacterized protein n=1 Tax=Camellia lanceoleosa TaxID=1840588 RepID=A0ACC0HWE6_9ERIC|nr:hypothetical protein LOK49_LG04G02601 [Camellia lanceoleosa]
MRRNIKLKRANERRYLRVLMSFVAHVLVLAILDWLILDFARLVLIDESTQATEPECLIRLVLGVKQGLVVVPIWDSNRRQISRMLTASNLILILMEEAGCFFVVLKCVLAPVAAASATSALRIPTIGIGAETFCSGQVN